MMRRNILLAILSVVLIISGCATSDRIVYEEDELYSHIVRMNRDGSPRDMPSGKELPMSAFKERQLRRIRESIGNNKQLKSVVVHVHGAPIIGDISLRESRSKMLKIRGPKVNDGYLYHPIMFNWDGTFFDVYGDRLYRVRSGKEISTPRGVLTGGAYFLEDVAGVLGTSFASIGNHINHVFETEFPSIDISREQFEAKERQAILRSDSSGMSNSDNNGNCEDPLLISDTPSRTPASPAGSVANVVRASPFVAFSPFLVSFGRSAWENYDRRTKLAIRKGQEYSEDGTSGREKDDSPTGMFAVMMNEILSKVEDINENQRGQKVNVYLIGHSAGTMIISEYIGSIVARERKGNGVNGAKRIEKIVFLSGAASIDLVRKTVIPFMKMNMETKFFNITLDAISERRSELLLGFTTPSILEWLDLSFAEPTSFLDRVIGKWENMMLAAHTIPCEIRDRFHMKQLGQDYPRRHNEMDEWNVNPFDENKWHVKKP